MSMAAATVKTLTTTVYTRPSVGRQSLKAEGYVTRMKDGGSEYDSCQRESVGLLHSPKLRGGMYDPPITKAIPIKSRRMRRWYQRLRPRTKEPSHENEIHVPSHRGIICEYMNYENTTVCPQAPFNVIETLNSHQHANSQSTRHMHHAQHTKQPSTNETVINTRNSRQHTKQSSTHETVINTRNSHKHTKPSSTHSIAIDTRHIHERTKHPSTRSTVIDTMNGCPSTHSTATDVQKGELQTGRWRKRCGK